MAGFRSPAFWLGISGGTGAQGGFRTPLPGWNAGGTPAVVQGGFRTALPFWNAGGGLPVEPEPVTGGGGGMYPRDAQVRARILREDEEILAVIMAYTLH